MIIDSSILIAILKGEPDAADLAHVLGAAHSVEMSAASLLETTILAGRTRRVDVDELVAAADVRILPVDEEHISAAQEAWARYGRGSGSPAQLNFGDCFSYAAAKVTDQPLLFKGDDFVHTDIEAVL